MIKHKKILDIIESYVQKTSFFSEEDFWNLVESEAGPIPSSSLPFFAASLLHKIKRWILLVTPSNREAELYYRASSFFLERERSFFFPGYESLPFDAKIIQEDMVSHRLSSLSQIISASKPSIVFTSADAMSRILPSFKKFQDASISISKGMEYDPHKLLEQLISLGYERKEQVEVHGDICRKGSVLDIYPMNFNSKLELPIRLSYLDDSIDRISFFDTISKQAPKPTSKMAEPERIVIYPAGEIVIGEEEKRLLLSAFQKAHRKNLSIPVWEEELRRQKKIPFCPKFLGIENFLPIFSKDKTSLIDYFLEPPLVLYYPSLAVGESFSRIQREFASIWDQKRKDIFCLSPSNLLVEQGYSLRKKSSIPEKADSQKSFSEKGSNGKFLSQNEFSLLRVNPYGSQEIGIKETKFLGNKMSEIRSTILQLIKQKDMVVIISPYQPQLQRIASLFQKDGIKISYHTNMEELGKPNGKTLYFAKISLQGGFSVPSCGLYVFSDTEIFGRSYQKRSRFKSIQSSPLESFLDLQNGDYVVHVTHGIGQFLGLEKIQSLGKKRDFLVVEYADQARLYIPLDQISMIQRYSASTEKPRLDSLGQSSFKNVRKKVEEEIQKIAEELLQLHARRMNQRGFAFPLDTAWQEEFESLFPYQETPDQETSIQAVKKDMESSKPMDRLLCGDAGYGKTEVAIRAAFKAILAGRQVLLISPTTILAFQHFQTFQARFQNYPIHFDWISRFRNAADIRKIKLFLREGKLDMLIGTHSLLASDIRMKNPGLMIIDEEQRFGVVQKETFKRLRSTVDILSMSATPIPRTLHMSLTGIRDLSIIRTPPKERIPIKTYVIEDNERMIRESILKEKKRNGQIFYLHNRIATIESAAARIQTIVPEASLSVLHGQMEEDQIEDILLQFLNEKFDILLTTSLIESGMDMPNVNTLFIERADTFGLSQLYQIRGRVGRSNKQAYAYFLYPPNRTLTETAQKRLDTVLEYQELGSGFKIAMRDLEIRGAGNILGLKQSGHIAEVGYELYIKLLNEAIKKLKGDTKEENPGCNINLHTDFYIPESYILDVRQRIEFYKRFEAARDSKEIDYLYDEMKQRFGEPDEVTKTFVAIERIRSLAQRAGFSSVYKQPPNRIEFRISEYFSIPRIHLVRCIQKRKGLFIRSGKEDSLFYDVQDASHYQEEIVSVLNELLTIQENPQESHQKRPSTEKNQAPYNTANNEAQDMLYSTQSPR